MTSRSQLHRVFVPSIAMFMASLVRENWVVILPFAKADLGLTNTEAGLFMTTFFVSYVVMQLPGGFLADKYAPIIILGIAQVTMGAATILLGWIVSPVQGFSLRFLAGVAGGLIFGPGLKQAVEGGNRDMGYVVGYYMAAPIVCLATMGVTLPAFILRFGWRSAFILTGVLASLSGIICLLARGTSPKDKTGSLGAREMLSTMSQIARDRGFLSGGLGAMLGSLGTWGVTVWLLDYLLVSRDLSTSTAVLAFAAFGFSNIVGRPLGGRISDVVGRKIVVVTGLLGYALTCAVTTTIVDTAPLILVVSILGLTTGIWLSPFYVMVVELANSINVGATSAFANAMTRVGVAVAPVVFGYIIDKTGSYDYGIILMSTSAMLGALLVIPMKASRIFLDEKLQNCSRKR